MDDKEIKSIPPANLGAIMAEKIRKRKEESSDNKNENEEGSNSYWITSFFFILFDFYKIIWYNYYRNN